VPEILEVEMYRQAALSVVGRRVRSLQSDDPIVVKDALPIQTLVGSRVREVARHGKLLTIHFETGSIDLHFGMAGRIIVDGRSPIDELVYGASSNDRWIRFGIEFDQGFLAITDPRRFSRVAVSQVHDDLGPDAFSLDLCDAVRLHFPKRGIIKGALLNQGVVAGLGNMLVDEVLSRSGVDPRRDIATMKPQLIEKVLMTVVSVLPELLERGGSHMGDLAAELRKPGSGCPYDGHELARATVAGRTTYWCPRHQK
jgi:formamidopyrimidine-DNA glycosylase